ncbi:MAG TPA: HD domain-containing phosphohydrolase [Verrucomicrobiae bacterium]|jgi:putative two-component system response regulator|nr:HD domain-containing phosphohydrolase [Verrucomicrobiae bacterium]
MSASILIVVSDPGERESWKQLLTDQGYQTVAISTGERVPDLCAHLQPDLVLMQAGLPDVPGLEVCRRLKQDPRNRLTPVILIADPAPDRKDDRKDDRNGVPNDPSLQSAGADDLWQPRPSRWEALTRVQSLLQLKTYIDEQAEAVVVSLARTIEARDTYTHGHCDRIAAAAVRMAHRVGLSEEQTESLRLAGIIHDVGKVAVPDAVLWKPGPLTSEETAIIHRHPIEGERICSPLKSLRRVLPLIRHHHERLDGSGYPDGLRGDAIPLAARILQVVDIYDALTTDRPYREAYTQSQALATLYSEAEQGWLDPELVRIFAPVAAAPKSVHDSKAPEQFKKLRHIV